MQPKLTIGAVNDPAEREADQVAGQVMRMAESSVAADDTGLPAIARHGGGVQRMCADCEQEKQHGGTLQRAVDNAHAAAPSSGTPDAAPRSVHHVLRSPGQPLDTATRAFMEPRFGQDFGAVRVHADGAAQASARDVNARAYAVGSNIVFGAGQYDHGSASGRQLIAHELTHVLQQSESGQDAPARLRRSVDVPGAAGAGGGAPVAPPAPAPAGPAPAAAPNRLEVDVLAAQGADRFLVRAAGEDLGVDIMVTSMEDMITQLAGRVGTGSCLAHLDIFNHANPYNQIVAGGTKTKLPTGKAGQTEQSGFSLDWLGMYDNQGALNRLRGLFCCDAEMRWYGCSTAGIAAAGATRTPEEIKSDEDRYGKFGHWYHTVEEAAAHGATSFKEIGTVNLQSWANALCTPVSGATDITSWNSSGKRVIRTIRYGGNMIRIKPQLDMSCACDSDTKRVAGSAPLAHLINQRAIDLREQALNPLYEQTHSVIGRPTAPESASAQAERQKSEQSDAEQARKNAGLIRANIIAHAGFAGGAEPKTPDEAAVISTKWGLPVATIVSKINERPAAVPDRPRGHVEEEDQRQTQRRHEASLSPEGREKFMNALRAVRREPFWEKYLQNNTIYIFPDVPESYSHTQTGKQTDSTGRTTPVSIIHFSRPMLEKSPLELVTTNLIHELTHTIHATTTLDAMKDFQSDLATLLADHPDIQALRTGAGDAAATAASRQDHITRIRQFLYNATSYAEGEILSVLQQYSHQPNISIGPVNAAENLDAVAFVQRELNKYLRQIFHIGLPESVLVEVIVSIRKRTIALYDLRIAEAKAGPIRTSLESAKFGALNMFDFALRESSTKKK